MDQLRNEAATASTSRTSRVKPPMRRKSGAAHASDVSLLATGNALLLATIRDLRLGGFPIELRNVQVDGVWVAHLRMQGQMWMDDGGLKSSEVADAKKAA